MSVERLQKILAQAGLSSRRGAKRLIEEGRIKVDGQIAQGPGQRVDTATSTVTINGREIPLAEPMAYLMFHKPAGYVTTMSDPQGRPTVKDLLKGIRERVFPVGRLDRDVSGLLILTNDGDLATRLMHPSFMIPKVYRAKVEGNPGSEFVRLLKSGRLIIEGKPAAPAKAKILRSGPCAGWLELVLTEGRNRQVKRMCAAAGHPVKILKRISYCSIDLPPSLPPGEYAPLSSGQVAILKASVGLEPSGASSPKAERSGRAPELENEAPKKSSGAEPLKRKQEKRQNKAEQTAKSAQNAHSA